MRVVLPPANSAIFLSGISLFDVAHSIAHGVRGPQAEPRTGRHTKHHV
jgi:hypothetical protein